jgi:cysteine-rich repeat protein
MFKGPGNGANKRNLGVQLLCFFAIAVNILGCIQSGAVPCGDLLCSQGSVCLAGTCATPDEIRSCENFTDGMTCTTSTRSNGLFCVAGACVGECGDGKIQGREVCDDGNVASGDGCTSTCLSKEVCGDGVLDPLKSEQCDGGVAGLSGDGCSSTCALEFDSWLDISPKGMLSASGTAMAYDELRNITVAFGGIAGVLVRDETREWDGVFWIKKNPPVSPPARFAAAMAYDSVHKVVVLFGGRDRAMMPLNDTWTFDGVQWTKLELPNSPFPRLGHTMAALPNGDIMLYGGSGSEQGTPTDDLWRYNGTWTEITSSPSPGPRMFHSMAAVGDSLLLYGGLVEGDSFSGASDTWRWKNNVWTPLLSATQPGSRFKAAMAHMQTAPPQTFLYGGFFASGPTEFPRVNGEFWKFSESAPCSVSAPCWTLVSDVQPRGHAAMSHDSRTRDLVIFGGEARGGNGTAASRDVFTFGTSGFVNRTPPSAPSGRLGMGAVFDVSEGRTLAFGGLGTALLNETWTFDGSTWLQKFPAKRPPGTANPALAYDVDNQRTIMFGGLNEGLNGLRFTNNLTWQWQNNTWTLITPSVSPPARQFAAMTYDSRRHRLVMFGGGGTNQFSIIDDTWEFDGTTWIDKTVSAKLSASYPKARSNHSMAFDPVRNVTVMAGGFLGEDGLTNETWEWNGDAWSLRTTTVAPAPFVDQTLAYDSVAGEMLLFSQDAMWSYNGTRWRLRPTTISPETRSLHFSVYDSVRRATIIFGGILSSGGVASDTWRFATQSPSYPQERCLLANEDTDGDGRAGCNDPDCWGRCAPSCPPEQACPPSGPRCGDGVCNQAIEDRLLCPIDCR